ncbi:transposable element Tcb2 transposase [Trichonephila clavipes]|nr:transposable element Tcb2 transposase [Trichonephila clavipes]
MLGSRTDLHIFDAGSVNGTRYCNGILLPYVRFFKGAMGLQFLFMDDNAPCHRTVAAKQLLESEDIEQFSKELKAVPSLSARCELRNRSHLAGVDGEKRKSSSKRYKLYCSGFYGKWVGQLVPLNINVGRDIIKDAGFSHCLIGEKREFACLNGLESGFAILDHKDDVVASEICPFELCI